MLVKKCCLWTFYMLYLSLRRYVLSLSGDFRSLILTDIYNFWTSTYTNVLKVLLQVKDESEQVHLCFKNRILHTLNT